MAKDYEGMIPEYVPYFDPAGVYKVEACIEVVQTGRMEEQPDGSHTFKPLNDLEVTKIPAKANNVPVDGIQIMVIAFLKCLQDIQAAGMIVRTPIGEGTPEAAKYEGMLEALNRPSFTPSQLSEILSKLKQ